MRTEVDDFLTEFLSPPRKESTPPLDRAKYWLAVGQAPAGFYPDADEYELRYRRRLARQNLRRILLKHPETIPLLKEVPQ